MGRALFHALFTAGTPLIDVRAQVEFDKGAFPTAVNMPILTDDERKQVGTCYRHQGPAAAVGLGHRLVSGDVRQARVERWLGFVAQNPSAHLYCFRGGQRSAIAAQWLAAEGVQVPRIPGGYKAMRRYLIECLEQAPPTILLGGRTGSGKTRVLARIAASRPRQVIDLEAQANHRGSAFGKHRTPQPTQINFENTLAIQLLNAGPAVIMEDEGKLIGHLLIPCPVQDRMNQAPILVLNAGLDARVENIRNEYVVALWHEIRARTGTDDEALAEQKRTLHGALDAIKKRLGGAGHTEARLAMDAAFQAQQQADFTRHDDWIRLLLTRYYDPMYDFQLAQRQHRVAFSGNEDELIEHAETLLDAPCRVA